MAALKWTVSNSRCESAPTYTVRCAGWKSGEEIGWFCRPIQTRPEPAPLRRPEDVGMTALERMRRRISGARNSARRAGHVAAVAVAITGIIVYSDNKMTLQSCMGPLLPNKNAPTLFTPPSTN